MRRVLMVDDSELTIGAATVAMERAGYAVKAASSLVAARAVLAEWLPDVVLLDVEMPGLAAGEIGSRIKSDLGSRAITILLYSGRSEDELEPLARELGVDGFLTKAKGVRHLTGHLKMLFEQKDQSSAMHKLILRAEVTAAGRTTVTRTREISGSEIVIPLLEPLPVGAAVQVRLSFPGLMDPFEVSGVVTAHHARSGLEEVAAVTIGINPGDGSYPRALTALLAPPPVSTDTEARDFRILIVDDNNLLLDMFEYGVEKYFRARGGGVAIDVARDGAEAWVLLTSKRYDLVIADYYLPVVDGAQLIAQMRADERVASVPVVAISVGGKEAREASTLAGADIFLDKPVVLRDLVDTLDRLVRHRRSR